MAAQTYCHTGCSAVESSKGKAFYQRSVLEGCKILTRDAALADIDRAIELEPNNADYWQQKAAVLDDMDEFEQSLVAAEKACQLNPKMAQAWETKALILDHLNRQAEGLKAMNQAVKLAPYQTNMMGQALLLTHTGKFDQAEQVLDNVVKLYPLSEIPHGRRAAVAKHTQHWDKVITDVTFVINAKEKAGDRGIGYHEALQDRAAAFIQTKNYKEAISACKYGLKQFPDDRQMHSSLLNAYKTLGDKSGALAEERALKALDSDFRPYK